MSTERMIPTPVGDLAVRVVERTPDMPTALLWHSLFVDSRTWSRVEGDLSAERRLVIVDGPEHGRSGDSGSRYTMADCADAAATVLEAVGVEGPVDWVGNAWGGHVGILFAAQRPERCRTLITVGTPVQAYDLKGRLELRVLLMIYRLLGPVRFIRDRVVEALLAPRTRAEDPEAVELVRGCFGSADGKGLANAVVSISLHRADLTPELRSVRTPTLFVTGDQHSEWPLESAQEAARLAPNGAAALLSGTAYLGPLEAPTAFSTLVREFWADPHATAAR